MLHGDTLVDVVTCAFAFHLLTIKWMSQFLVKSC